MVNSKSEFHWIHNCCFFTGKCFPRPTDKKEGKKKREVEKTKSWTLKHMNTQTGCTNIPAPLFLVTGT